MSFWRHLQQSQTQQVERHHTANFQIDGQYEKGDDDNEISIVLFL
jgi:hypothetical protein